EVLKSVQGLTKITAQARPNTASVTLEFEVGTDLDEALVRVSNKLQQVPSYPESARQPIVSTADSSGPPLAVVIISSRTYGEPVAQYRTWVAEEVIPQIERVKGVAGVRHIGGQDTEIHIDFDPKALAARGLRVRQVAQQVQGELRDRSGGDLTVGKRRVLVRTMLAPEEVEDMEEIIIGVSDARVPIRLGDVASVRVGLRKATGVAFVNDTPSMALLLSREAGTNVLEVSQDIRDVIEDLNERAFAPEGLQIAVVSDQTGYINGALDLVRQNLLLGALLAVFVLLLFLRSFGACVIISISIPVCVFGTALGMTLLGRTVNVVSLAGVTFAIGMVVDNSIVALENIDTWRRRVGSSTEAAYKGVKEVWGALIASTATTAAVFIPIILWQGEVGELLRDVAYSIALAVVISFLVSVLVIPSLSAKFLKAGLAGGDKEAPDSEAPSGALSSALNAAKNFRNGIARAVGWLTAIWWRSALVIIVAVSLTSGAALGFLPKLEYLPTGNRNLVFGIMVPPPGYAVEELERIGRGVQSELVKHLDKEIDGNPAVSRSFFVGSPERLFGGAVAVEEDRAKELVPFLRGIQGSIPGMIAFATQASLFGRSIGGGRAVEVEISGPELSTLVGIGRQMFGRAAGVLPDAQIRPVPGLDDGAPEYQLRPRRDEAAPLLMTGDE
ncbi:MAG: efflux RND transporter permease subunit, partial [Myxococcota bacterium]